MKHLTPATIAFAMLATPAFAQDNSGSGVTAGEHGLTFEAGDFQLNLGGRLHLDGAFFDDPAAATTGVTDAAVRRARIELSAKFGDLVRLRVDREFAGASIGWRNVWLAVEPVKGVEVKGGNMIVPFAMEDLQSSNTMPFAERSLASALMPGYGLGGAVTVNGKNWSAAAGYFTDPLNNDEGRSSERGKGVVGRVTVAPLNSSGKVVHFGLGAEHRTFSATEAVRFSGDAGSVLAPTLMSSGTLGGLDHLTAWTGEAGLALGPLLVMGHANRVHLARPLLGDRTFNGQTLQASFLVTGGRYGYAERQGVFGGPDLSKRKSAVELALRYSRLDLDDAATLHGIGRALSAGANWYINRNLRVMAGYTDSRVHFPVGGTPVRNRVGTVRLQLNF